VARPAELIAQAEAKDTRAQGGLEAIELPARTDNNTNNAENDLVLSLSS
jgi:hypothetical protein